MDVSLNKPIKEAYKQQWTEWIKASTPVYTQMGNRQRASYQTIVDMVSNALTKINKPAVVKGSFEHCGLVRVNSVVDFFSKLNPRLQPIICPDRAKLNGVSNLLEAVIWGAKESREYTDQMSFEFSPEIFVQSRDFDLQTNSVVANPKRKPRALSF